jgi:hypothetical protein
MKNGKRQHCQRAHYIADPDGTSPAAVPVTATPTEAT